MPLPVRTCGLLSVRQELHLYTDALPSHYGNGASSERALRAISEPHDSGDGYFGSAASAESRLLKVFRLCRHSQLRLSSG